MKIVHLSDLHLGRKSATDQHGADRLSALRNALKEVSNHSPDAILVAGDVFDNPSVEKALIETASRVLGSVENVDGNPIPTVVIPGNHDPSESTSLWKTFTNSLSEHSNVRLALEPELISLLGGKLLVEAYPCETRYSAEPPWAKRLDVPKTEKGTLRIVLAHGTLQGGPVPKGESDAYPFTLEDVESLGVDYVALGHFHGVYPAWEGGEELERKICYSGTHEPDQHGSDSGWAILISLESDQPARLRRIQVGSTQWHDVSIRGPADIEHLTDLFNKVETAVDPRCFVVQVNIHPDAKFTDDEAEQLKQMQNKLQVLGARVSQRGDYQALINVESLDLEGLPYGAVKEALLSLKEELLECRNDEEREILPAALQLGWGTFKDTE